MKVLLYTEAQSVIGKSGIGKTLQHQQRALSLCGIDVTLNEKDHYDLAHINTVYLKSRHLARKLHKQEIPVVYHAHSTYEDFKNSFIFSNAMAPFIKKWLIQSYLLGDVIVTPTEYSKKLLESYGIKKRIYTVSNGIDLDFFNKDQQKAMDFRKDFGYSEKDKIVMGVGLYIERKGILDFVAMAKLLPQYQFIWFGYTPLLSVPRKVRQAVRQELPNLRFAGYVSSDILRNAYCGADLFWFPTYEETEGIVLLEALACKQRILVRDIPIYKDDFIDGVHVYKGKNNEEFHRLIVKILENELPDISENGYKIAADRSLANIGGELQSIYLKLLNTK